MERPFRRRGIVARCIQFRLLLRFKVAHVHHVFLRGLNLGDGKLRIRGSIPGDHLERGKTIAVLLQG